jgi:hypothetical protein
VEQSCSEAETRFDRLETLTEKVHREVGESKAALSRVVVCGMSTTAELNGIQIGIEELGPRIDQLGVASREMHLKMDGLRDRMTSTQSIAATQLELAVRHESSVTREEILALRSDVLSVMTGTQARLSNAGQTSTVRLSDADKADLVTQLRRELMSCPGTFEGCVRLFDVSGKLAASHSPAFPTMPLPPTSETKIDRIWTLLFQVRIQGKTRSYVSTKQAQGTIV